MVEVTGPLIVLLGAGASHDCASEEVERHPPSPPLASQLFDTDYNQVLARYPAAQMVAADLRKEGRLGNALAIEELIRTRYRESDHPLDRKKYASLPCYLQDLLFTVGDAYVEGSQPDNYDLLVSGVLQLPDVIFITLNYDTLLDDRLAVLDPIASLDDYVDPSRRWSLVKLHGSVNWGRRVQRSGLDTDFHNLDPDLALAETIELRDFDDLEWGGTTGALDSVRFDARPVVAAPYFPSGEPPGAYYPAVSVPIGTGDELVCPDAHVEFLRERLDTSEPKHLLVIGYSANDREVIRLFQEAKPVIQTLMVVSTDSGQAGEIADNLQPEICTPDTTINITDDQFGSFVQGAGLDNYLAGIA
jgi:hypothetical protein